MLKQRYCEQCNDPVNRSYRVRVCGRCQLLAVHENHRKPFIIRQNGYKYIHMSGHHLADKQGYVAEHRLVAEQAVGRSLKKGEVVHHIDEDKLNNAPENLVVMASAGVHTKLAHPEVFEKLRQANLNNPHGFMTGHQGFNKKPPNQRVCKTCNRQFVARPFEISRKFCSRNCYVQSQSAGVSKHCLVCGVQYHVKPSGYERKKYCSRKCFDYSKTSNFQSAI